MKQFTAEESALAKSLTQSEANAALDANGGSGLVVMATGSGKSKIGIDRANRKRMYYIDQMLCYRPYEVDILLVVPTVKLRDETWKAEFYKWEKDSTWNEHITAICYDSLHTIKGRKDLIILDECHNITEANSIPLLNGDITWGDIIGLTATEPRKLEKKHLLEKIGLKLVYELTLDQAVERGIVAPYEITVVSIPLNSKDKYIKSGKKDKYFYQTEVDKYNYLTLRYLQAPTKTNALTRMRFIYNLKSKTEAAKKILEHLIPEDLRTLIFCGTKDQANEVCKYRYYSKPSKPKLRIKTTRDVATLELDMLAGADYEDKMKEYQGDVSYELFMQCLINRMSCVDALNEGQNFPDIDCGLMIKSNSSDLSMIQRLGRHIRYRERHKGKIIILCAKDTVDEEWTRKATIGLDQDNIRWIEYKKLRKGEEQINF